MDIAPSYVLTPDLLAAANFPLMISLFLSLSCPLVALRTRDMAGLTAGGDSTGFTDGQSHFKSLVSGLIEARRVS